MIKTKFIRFNSKTLSAIALIFVTSLLAHEPLVRIGPALSDSDIGWNVIESDRFKNGEWPVFYHGLWYSGTTLGAFRAFWSSVWSFSVSGLEPYVAGQMTFSYFVMPFLMALAVFFLVSRFGNYAGALVSGTIAAFGLQYWTLHYGVDWYYGVFLLGALLLGFRSNLRNPFLELSPHRLFLLAVLSGLALYTGRSFLIYFVVFWFPLDVFFLLAKEFWEKRKQHRVFFAIVAGLLILYGLLEVLGPDVGTFAGKRIRLHGYPNLDYALAVFSLWALLKNWKWLTKNQFYWKRLALFSGGLFLGLSRELFADVSGPRLWGRSSLAEMGELVLRIPHAFETLVAAPGTPATFFSVLLLLVPLIWIATQRSTNAGRIVLFGIFLCVIAFLRIRPHTPGDPRYLFTLFPFLFLALGCFLSETKTRPVLIVTTLVILGHVGHHLSARRSLAVSPELSKRTKDLKTIRDTFRTEGVEIVYCDSFFESNQLMLFSGKNPAFINPGLHPLEAQKKWKKHNRVGLALTRSPSTRKYVALGRTFEITPIKKVVGFQLFVAKALNVE